ncbi:hypothetical protein AA313_de0200738 [Arthrobotrys entomopaga]|nr:hypothetical protein AA313_de0200738 [Arthrobotrys entomopaga]
MHFPPFLPLHLKRSPPRSNRHRIPPPTPTPHPPINNRSRRAMRPINRRQRCNKKRTHAQILRIHMYIPKTSRRSTVYMKRGWCGNSYMRHTSAATVVRQTRQRSRYERTVTKRIPPVDEG